MKKFDTFQTFARGAKSLVAILLVMLMAVGSLFADQVTFTFSEQGYTNNQEMIALSPIAIDNNVNVSFSKGTGSTTPKYLTNGTAVRAYGGNTMTIAAAQDVEISSVNIIFGSSDGTNAISVDNGTYADGSWSGNANTIVFTIGGTSGHRRIAGLTVTYTVPSTPATVAAPAFTPAAGTYTAVQSVTLATTTEGATIYYTVDGTEPTAESLIYQGAISVNENMTIKAIAILGEDQSTVATANYVINLPLTVTNIAAFKALDINEVATITGDVVVLGQYPNYLFVQDATGALVIYGSTSYNYNAGDVISGGINGKRAVYNGMNQMSNPGSFTAGVAGTPVEPVVVSAADLIANYVTYESKLVTIENVELAANHTFTASGADRGVDVTQGESTITVYDQFKVVTGETVSAGAKTVTGYLAIYVNNNTTRYEIFPRGAEDITDYVAPIQPLDLDSIATLPYAYNFDEGTDPYFMIDNGEAVNAWYIGQAQGFDNNKLYISSNNGITNKYDVTKASNVMAYRTVVIPETGAILSFDYRVYGQAGYDYLKVNLVKGGTTTTIATLQGENEWTSFSYDISGEMAGEVCIQFNWVNNAAAGSQFPAAIDNISVIETPCSQPTHLTANVDSTTAVITWVAVEGQTAWNFQYKLANHSEWYTIAATDTTVTLTDLQGNSNYDMRVQAVCGEYTSAWTTGAFAVACQEENVVTAPADVVIGTGTSGSSSTWIFPGFYGWQYAAHLYDMENDGAIHSIGFYLTSASTTTGSSMTVWVKAVDANYALAASNTFNDMLEGAQQIYDGEPDFSTAGWITFPVNNFSLNEGQNLLVLVRGVGCSTGGGCSKSARYTSTSNHVWYKRQDSSDPGQDVAGTLSSYRANININMDVTTISCVDVVACADPSNLEVSDITPNSAVLTWTAGAEGQTDFIVEYLAEGATEWTSVNVSGTTYTLTGLAQLTNYSVSVKANCGTNNWSEVITGSFRTVGVCPSVTNLETANVSNTTTLTWTAGGTETAWLVQFKPATAGDDAWTSIEVSLIPMTTFGGLQGNVDYDVRVKAMCDPNDAENQSEWATTSFHSGCAAFELPFVEEFPTNTMPICWENQDFLFASSGYAYTNTNGAELITPAINIPAENPTYLAFEVRGSGDYTVLASYRGTRADRFTEIYTGTAPNQNTVVTIALDDLYKGRAVNFKIVNNSTSYQYFYFVKVNQCPFEVTNLVSTDYTGTTVALAWTADEAATNYQIQYGEQGFDLGDGTVVDVIGATENTISQLNYETTYDFYVRVVCEGDNGPWYGPVSVTTAPACSDPNGLSFESVSAQLSWNAGEWGAPAQYNVRYKEASAEEYTTEVVNVPFEGWNPFVTISGLASNTTYEMGVQSVCGENMESNWVSITFTTPCMPLPIPYSQDFEGDVFPPECWSQTYVVGTQDWEATVDNSYGSGTNDASFTYASVTGNTTMLMTPAFDLSTATTTGVVLKFKHSQAAWGSDQDELSVYYRPSYTSNWSLLHSYTNSLTSMTQEEILLPAAALTSSCQFAFEAVTNYGHGVFVDDVTIEPAPTCGTPSISVAGLTATITPNLSYGTPVSYELILNGDAENTVTVPATTTSFALNEVFTTLALNTSYTLAVRAICGTNDNSEWSVVVPFTTPACWESCTYIVEMEDSYGDGWNGNAIYVIVDGVQQESLTVPSSSSSATATVLVCSGAVSFKWHVGSYPGETSFIIKNESGATVYTCTDGSTLSEGDVLYSAYCGTMPSCGTPSISLVGTEVTITPNAYATSTPIAYELMIGAETHSITTTTANLNDLFTLVVDEEYELFVRAICGESDASEWVSKTFIAPIACQGTVEEYAITGTSGSTSYLPSYSLYDYSLTQQLYLASEVGIPQGGIIYSLSLNVTGAKSRNIDLYVGTTTSTTVSSWITDANFQKVYSGTAFAQTGTNEFTFTTPIVWNGTDNIVVMVDDNTGSYSSGLAVTSHSGATNKARYVYRDNTDYVVSSISTYGGTTTSTRNNIVFNICANPEPPCPAPKNITLGTVTETTAQVSWTAGSSETEWEVSYTVGDQTVTETTTNNPYTITGLSASSVYVIPFSVKALCSATEESTVSTTALNFNTVCGLTAVPFEENFDAYTSTTTQSSMVMPLCWNRQFTGTSTSYGAGIYNSTTYAVSGTNSLRLYAYGTTSTSTSYGDAYAVMPEIDAALNTLMISFDAKTNTSASSYAYYRSVFELGVVSDPTDPASSFTSIQEFSAPVGGQRFTIALSDVTATGHLAFRATKNLPADYTSYTYMYNYTFIDNILVEAIPTCFVPSQPTVSNVTDHTADVSWTDNFGQTNFAVEYQAEGEATWTSVAATTTSVSLSNLLASTNYTVRVKAVCGTNDESEYTEEVNFTTVCEHGLVATIAGTGSNYYYMPVSNYYRYSYSQQIIDESEIAGTGLFTSIAFEYAYSTPMSSKNNVKIYLGVTDKTEFSSTTDWITTGLQEVYAGSLNCVQGWNEFSLNTPFAYSGGNVVVVVEDLSNAYDGSSYTFKTTSTTGYKAMYYQNDSNPFSGNTASGRVQYRSNMKLIGCPEATDLAITSINEFNAACDVEGAVTIGVKNLGYEGTVSTFEAYYQVNDGTPVHETVTLATPIAMNEAAEYTFNQLPTFTASSNIITAWVELTGDLVDGNNTITSAPITVLAPKTVPYQEYFGEIIGWNAIDANNDGITMIADTYHGLSYSFNDELAADDWMMSPCVELAAGTYTVSYNYGSASALTESFEVYYGNGAHIADMTNLIATHTFNYTGSQTATTTITVPADGIYNFGFHATSLAGNLGFNIYTFSVQPVNDVIVTFNENGGTVTPNGTVAVNYGEDLTLNLVPAPMYHVAGVWVDDVQVVPEDGTGANFMLYTLENITEPHNVYVDFKLEFHIFKTVENYKANLYDEPGGAFVPAATDTTINPDPFTVNMVADPHYHLAGLTVSPMVPDSPEDVFAGVVNNGDGTYSYTIDTLVVANYYVNATFRRDTVAINYNVLTGKGYANDSELLNAGDTYTTWVDYSIYNDVDTTVTFAAGDNYHIVDVFVNGVSQGRINSYTFENVQTTQTVDIKYGYKVDAFVSNYNTYDDIQTVMGTIAPETQYIAEYDPMTVTGTVEEHFHLYQLLVNGVNRIDEVVFGADPHYYSFTMDSIADNYTIEAVVKVDTFAVTYNIVAGQGYADESDLLVAPATYYNIHNYGDDWYSNIIPATGYAIENVTLDGQNLYTANNYQFNYLVTSHVFDVTFAPVTYNITTNAYGQGTVSDGMTFTFDPENPVDYEFVATPAEGYYVSAVFINGEAQDLTGVEGEYTTTIDNVADNYVIDAHFSIFTYTMTAEAANGGTITPAGTQIVNYGTDMTYEINANEGWYIASTDIDGITTNYTQDDAEVTLTVPYTAINADHSVSVTFAQFMYTITGTVGANGTVNGATVIDEELVYGSNYAMTITPAANYQVADVVVDGTSVGAVNFYEFINITADHTVDVTFEAIMYTLTATSNTEGCTITPATTTVQAGSNVSYTVTAAAGYHLLNVIANGEEVTVTNNAFTITDVQSDYTIYANFAPNNVTVTVDQPAHATITPGTMTYTYGATPSYMIVPETGYNIVSVTAGNAVITVTYNNGIGTFTLPALHQDITLTATTEAQTFTITVTQGANGTITPGTQTNVTYGSDKTFTIAANNYYAIVDVIVDGSSRGPISSYTFHNVTGDHTITAIFEEDCNTPTNLVALNITTTSADLNWTGTADSYEVRYRAADQADYTIQTVTGNTLALTNLTPNTLYAWGVRALCGSNLSSEWVDNSFTTKLDVGIANAEFNNVKVYSYQNTVYIVNEDGVAISNVDIYDIYGKQVYTGKVLSSPEVISLDVANGNYVVRLATDKGVGVYKVSIVR